MNRAHYLLLAVLLLITFFLFNSIFFGEKNYSKRNSLVKESTEHTQANNNLKKENEILEFEIKNAQDSNDHVENFARENLNLTYPDEEFIYFKKEEQDEQK